MTSTEIIERNREIVEKYIENGLIDDCVSFQFAKVKEKQYMEDLKNDLILELYSYKKLAQVEKEGHMNALVTRMIRNNVYSSTSWYYRRYIRPDRQADEITEKERQIPDGEQV